METPSIMNEPGYSQPPAGIHAGAEAGRQQSGYLQLQQRIPSSSPRRRHHCANGSEAYTEIPPDIVYRQPPQQDTCCTIRCKIICDQVAIVAIITLMASFASADKYFWYGVVIGMLYFFFGLYTLILACSSTRTSGTYKTFRAYSCLSLSMGLTTLVVAICLFASAIYVWSNDDWYKRTEGERNYEVAGYFLLALGIICLIAGSWLTFSRRAFDRDIIAEHQDGVLAR